jgi:hypothetical protein
MDDIEKEFQIEEDDYNNERVQSLLSEDLFTAGRDSNRMSSIKILLEESKDNSNLIATLSNKIIHLMITSEF